jgi:hypothetical protein
MSVIPKSSVGPAKGTVVHVSAVPQQVAMVVETPPAHQQVDLSLVAARPVIFNFDPSTVHPQVVEGNLVLDFPNGGAVVLHNSQDAAQNGATMVTLPDGSVIPLALLLQNLPHIQPASGTLVPPHSSGGVPQAFELGSLGSSFTPIGGLDLTEQTHAAVFLDEQRFLAAPDPALASSATVIDGEDPSVTSTLRSTESITVTGLSGAGGTATGVDRGSVSTAETSRAAEYPQLTARFMNPLKP